MAERPWSHTDDLRNEEPPDDIPDNVSVLIPRCHHPWLQSVCVDCGLTIGVPEMHPEER